MRFIHSILGRLGLSFDSELGLLVRSGRAGPTRCRPAKLLSSITPMLGLFVQLYYCDDILIVSKTVTRDSEEHLM